MGTSEILMIIFGSGGGIVILRDLGKAFWEWHSGKPQKRRDLISELSSELEGARIAASAWQTGFFDLYNLAHKLGADAAELAEIENRVKKRLSDD